MFNGRTTLSLLAPSSQLLASVAYGYDGVSRLNSATSGTAAVGYSYLANSPLVQQITFTNSAAPRMTTTKAHDFLNRLTSIQSLNPQLSTLNSSAYDYNSANQRTLRREADGSYWRYEFDSLGQVKSGKKYWSDGTSVAGQQFEYGFDDIGNRTAAKAGGDETGLNLRSAAYSADMLNRYVIRTNTGAVDVMGIALATNTVTVNTAPTYRKGEYFRKQLPVNNSSGPVWQEVSISAPGETAVTRHEFVPPAQEAFDYDLDGNLTQDARWNCTWDVENRLVRMEARSGTWPQHWLTFEYDWRGRRTARNIGPIGSGTATNTVRFVDDGWNLLAVLNPQSTVLQSFLWGLDLSGSLQGAGGVGGLLGVYDPSTINNQPSTHFACFDGNGNLMALLNAGSGTLSAQYEYGPFGEVLRATGPMAAANPFRFSTKFQDDETGLLYYGFRYDDPNTGRWSSRDPRQESRDSNLYAFLRGCPVSYIDGLGLTAVFHIEFPLPEYKVPGPLLDSWGNPALAITSVPLAIKHYDLRDCGSGKKAVSKVFVAAQVTERFTMSRDEALTYTWYPASGGGQQGIVIQHHEDEHRALFARYYYTVYQGYMLLYGKCVCKPCYEQYEAYVAFLDQYANNEMWIDHDRLDAPLGNAQARADLDRRLANKPNMDLEMFLQGQLLLQACQGSIRIAQP